MSKTYRIGQIVPSSNTTMETEVPRMLLARQAIRPEQFTFHSSRMAMKHVTKEELAAMDAQSVGCARQLADAEVDIIGYACLVAIMSAGRGYHCVSEETLGKAVREAGHACPIVTSAGALVQVLREMRARKVSIVTPYMRPLTDLVVDYIVHEGIAVQDSIALEIPDNLAVGRRDPLARRGAEDTGPGLPAIHFRQHRRSQGRDADPRQSAGQSAGLANPHAPRLPQSRRWTHRAPPAVTGAGAQPGC